MVKDLVPVEVDVDSASAEFWRRYHVFRRARMAETRPGDPVIPDEVFERQMRGPHEFETVTNFEVVREGETVGFFSAKTVRPGAPGYEKNRDFVELGGAVAPAHRGRGIGSKMVPLALELLDRYGARMLNVWTEEESGHSFLRRLAGEPKFHFGENRLRLSEVDWAMARRWVEEGERRSPDTRLEVHAGPMPDALIDEFAVQLSGLLNTMPFDDMEHAEIVITAPMVRETDRRLEATQTTLLRLFAREADGGLSALTEVAWCAHVPTHIDQWFTGVTPSARGRGLGKWIKGAMLEMVRERYPQAEWIITGNAESNAPMLAINERLGFKPYRRGSLYQVGRERLAEVVAAARPTGRAGSS